MNPENSLSRPRAYGIPGGVSYNTDEFDAWMNNPATDSSSLKLTLLSEALLPGAEVEYHFKCDYPVFKLEDGRWLVRHGGVVNIYESAPEWLQGITAINSRLDLELLEGRDPVIARNLIENLDRAALEDYLTVHRGSKKEPVSVSNYLMLVQDTSLLECARDIFTVRYELEEKSTAAIGPHAQAHCSEIWRYRHILSGLRTKFLELE